MFDFSTINRIVDTFSISVKAPAMYFNNEYTMPVVNSPDIDYSEILEYAEFEEIINFMREYSGETKEVCRYYTENLFIYLLIKIDQNDNKSGFIVSGPFIPYTYEDIFAKDKLSSSNSSVHKRLKADNVIKNYQVLSESRISKLGHLLKLICSTEENVWYSMQHKSFGKQYEDKESNIHYVDVDNSSLEDINKKRIKFFYMLKNKVIRGDSENITDFIRDYSELISDQDTNVAALQKSKYKAVIILTVACVFVFETNAYYDKIINTFKSYLTSLLKAESGREVFIKTSHTLETLIHLATSNLSNNYSLHVNRVMQYLKAHFTEKHTLKRLSDYVGLSEVYLSALIKKETGMSFLEIINSIRVEEGKNLLLFTNKSIYEISHTLGYTYQNHFNKIFKKATGMTPIEFRQNYGSNYMG